LAVEGEQTEAYGEAEEKIIAYNYNDANKSVKQ
jgi:hypothetical protein